MPMTRLSTDEWMVEPEDEHCREYGRLCLKAELDGLNVDGQAVIPWEQLEEAVNQITDYYCGKEKQ